MLGKYKRGSFAFGARDARKDAGRIGQKMQKDS
jgi:hypothetical protein